MRWPFRRRPQAGAPSDSHGSRAEAAAAPTRRDWATLPPIEPAVGPAPLIAQRRAHHPGLPGAPVLERALAPLGHHLSADAPQGMVVGLAVPVTTASPGPLPPVRGMERHPQPEPAGVGEMPDVEPVRVLREADPSPPQMAPSLTRSPDPYSPPSSSPRTSPVAAGAAVTVAQRVTAAAATTQRSQPPGGAEGVAHIPAPRPSLGRSRRLGIGIPFSRTGQPSGAATLFDSAGTSAPLPFAESPGGPPSPSSSAALTVPVSLDSVTVDAPATSASPTLPSTRSSTAATPDAPETAGTPAVHTSPAAVPVPAYAVTSVEPAVSPPAVQRAADVPAPSATPPVPASSSVLPRLEVTTPRHRVLPDRAQRIDTTSSEEPATPVQRQPAVTIDPRAPWRGPLADVEGSHRHEPPGGPSGAPTEGPLVSGALPAPMRPPSPPEAAVRDSSTTVAAPEGAAAVVLDTSSPVTDVVARHADVAEVLAEPPAATAAELPLPPPVNPQRTSAPPSSPAPVTGPLASPPVTLQRSIVGVPSPPLLSQEAERASDHPATSRSAVADEPGSATHGPASTSAVTASAHRPTVAHMPLAVAAPLVQRLQSPPATLPSATGEWVAVGAPGTSTTSPSERPGWQRSPETADPSSGRGLRSLTAVQRDHMLEPRARHSLDLPLPLRAATGNSEPHAVRDRGMAPHSATSWVATPQRAVEDPGSVPPPPPASVQQQAAAEPAAAGAGAPGGGRSEGEMEELARRLYEHIGTRLRAELLVERERAGMVTDLR